ncbi:hypothetical protein K458DRAFT_392526 [Lentithecium fluviatile CBS 122367]|uniref:Uncharacterized protein n=1 Tax=Lentithecium fluviatile CBS 122367 TaxID=1168545 RepID=A0A6G1IRS2_9PLEO|nr:hypothetical protein K458DRAFT_392526 [Lentithecium fluviatile CBS 122367]
MLRPSLLLEANECSDLNQAIQQRGYLHWQLDMHRAYLCLLVKQENDRLTQARPVPAQAGVASKSPLVDAALGEPQEVIGNLTKACDENVAGVGERLGVVLNPLECRKGLVDLEPVGDELVVDGLVQVVGRLRGSGFGELGNTFLGHAGNIWEVRWQLQCTQVHD